MGICPTGRLLLPKDLRQQPMLMQPDSIPATLLPALRQSLELHAAPNIKSPPPQGSLCACEGGGRGVLELQNERGARQGLPSFFRQGSTRKLVKRLDKEAAARVGWPDIGGAALRELVRGVRWQSCGDNDGSKEN